MITVVSYVMKQKQKNLWPTDLPKRIADDLQADDIDDIEGGLGCKEPQKTKMQHLSMLARTTLFSSDFKTCMTVERGKQCIVDIMSTVCKRKKEGKGSERFEGAWISPEMVKWHLLVECDDLGVHIATPKVSKANRWIEMEY